MIDTSTLARPVTSGGPWSMDQFGNVVVPDGVTSRTICEYAGGDAASIAALPDWIAACDERDAEIERLTDLIPEPCEFCGDGPCRVPECPSWTAANGEKDAEIARLREDAEIARLREDAGRAVEALGGPFGEDVVTCAAYACAILRGDA